MIPRDMQKDRRTSGLQCFFIGTILGTSTLDGDLRKLDIDFLQDTLPVMGIGLDSRELKQIRRACLTRQPSELATVKEFAESLEKQVEAMISSEPELHTMYRLGRAFHILHHVLASHLASNYERIDKDVAEAMKTLVIHSSEQLNLAKEILCIELDSKEVTE